ncbi:MAG: AAA family ATPase [Lentimicrobium sp.]|jgi:predicted ATPase|nr:AAA family ATPase [Lentimicrobium sp.]
MANTKLSSIVIKGFRTIREMTLEPRDINIMIGPNGAGKSNFISFFSFLSWMLNSDGKLQLRVAELGGANDILFDGADITKGIDAQIRIENRVGYNDYKFRLQFAKPDRLVFAEEAYRYSKKSMRTEAEWAYCGSAHEEAKLPEKTTETAIFIQNLLRKLIVYQFHNTTSTSGMRLKWSTADGRYLKENGQNLGSFLLRMQQSDKAYYNRVIKYLRLVLPFFDDFDLYDEFGMALLRWKEKGTTKVFNAGQASDGMLRTIALVALLGQNPINLPAVVFLDEPELGLHPAAIDVLAGLIKAVSTHCQVFVATQSVSLVNNFDPEDLVVIERKGRDSVYHRPNNEELEAYLQEYSTGEIWEKNIIGGRP